MRNAFCQSLVNQSKRSDFIFLTGDLGYKALEPLRDVMGQRFINAGVAEQNMVAVAAGMAREGLRSWAYSIAPFIYARPYEHVRNDICLHDLPVVLVGNGGGYGYGVMGATHHALEDYGALLCLPNIRVYIPAFDSDVSQVTEKLFETQHPAYLRLGLGEEPKDAKLPPYAPWRKLWNGNRATIIAVGPLAGSLLGAIGQLPAFEQPNLWVLSELPVDQLPQPLMEDLKQSEHLMVVEEHVARGSAGEMLARHLLLIGEAPPRFTHRCAQGYCSGLYGSQKFHRKECGLDAESIIQALSSEGKVNG